MLLLAVTDRL